MKKRFLLIPAMLLSALTIAPAICSSYSNATHKKVNKSITLSSTNDQANANISYELVSTKKHGLNCGDERRYWQFLYWEAADQGSDTSFEEVRWCEPNRLLLRTEGHNNNERFIYQQIRVNINVPAHTKDYNVSFQGEIYEWFNWNCFVFGSRYQSAVQMFDLGDDINNHPDRFNNYAINKNDVDPRSILEHGWDEVGAGSKESVDVFTSKLLNWTFNNETDTPKTFNKYIGVSYWVGAQESWKNGAVKGDIKIGLRTSIDSIGEITHSLQKWGDIRVECCLTNEDQTCHLTKYVGGSGTLVVPDYVSFAGKDYYVREIPSNWSDGENDITSLKFADDVSHLTKICDNAFDGTNCLDYYINHKDELLVFPEGLEEIGEYAFAETDYGAGKIKGYSFPSTLKKICSCAFGSAAPYIDGDDDNGELEFKSVPEINKDAFRVEGAHACKYVYAPTLEMSHQIISKLTHCLEENADCEFYYSANYLIPRIKGAIYETIDWTFGDIVVKCDLTGDEARIAKYVSGSGILKIPDNVFYKGNTYYIKEIPSNWSDGENDIKGLVFEKDVSHLKKISAYAFDGTNCLDYYMKNKNELLIFPEGLEEIGPCAFSYTDCLSGKVKGYSFPSTLKKICSCAFGQSAPFIDGDDNNGVLEFRSVPEIDKYAFKVDSFLEHDCKFIRGKTKEMADQIVKLIKEKMSSHFNTDEDFLISKEIK